MQGGTETSLLMQSGLCFIKSSRKMFCTPGKLRRPDGQMQKVPYYGMRCTVLHADTKSVSFGQLIILPSSGKSFTVVVLITITPGS